MLGISKSGNAYVPLDPEYPTRRLSHIVSDAAIGLLLTNTANLEKSRTFQSGGLEIVNLDEPAPIEPGEASRRPIKGEDIVCLLYTSGSTGEPKGVVQSAQHILHVVRNYTNKICLASTDRVLVVGSLSHVAAMTDIWAGLLNGAVLCPFDVRTQGVEALVGWLCSERITVYHSVPTLYRLVIDALPSKASFVRAVVLGGEEVWKQDIDRFRRCFAPDSIFVNMYGSTESTVSAMYIVDQDMQVEADRVPVGYAVGDNEIVLLDETGRQALVSGEITVRSPFIPEGYWQKPEASAAAFLSDAAGIVYRTGDQGRFLADGSLLVLGRNDTQVKVRGFRVETGEVETALKRHPNVKEAVVKAWPDANGGKRLGALIVPNPVDEQPTVRSITTFLRPVLPAYMVPEAFRFMETLPRTPTGKIDFRSLPEPNWCEPTSDAAVAAPRTDTETVVANIWKEILRIERVSIHDRFFDLGGHSLNAVQLIARLRKAFRMELPLNDLFAAPTIAGVAEIIEHLREHPGPAGRLATAPTRLHRRATSALSQGIN
jgi:amino acid adenylation domain-containing protein